MKYYIISWILLHLSQNGTNTVTEGVRTPRGVESIQDKTEKICKNWLFKFQKYYLEKFSFL